MFSILHQKKLENSFLKVMLEKKEEKTVKGIWKEIIK